MPDIKKIDTNFENKEATTELQSINPKNDDRVKVYGLNWFEQDKRFVRFPKESDELIKNLAEGLHYLVEQPSGAMLAFRSNTSTLKIKVKLGHTFNMSHMPFTGQGGCDLYIGTKREDLTFFRCASYHYSQKEYEFTYFSNWEKVERLYLINLPLYGGILDIEVCVDTDAFVCKEDNLFPKGKIVCYGTSITQGGCASRGGMSYTNALSRRMGYEVLNFGFSGNGRGQKEIAELLSSIDNVKMFILDYEANATLPMLKDTLDNFINILRNKNPYTPILVLSKIRMSVENFVSDNFNDQLLRLKFQRSVVNKHRLTDKNIYFYDGHKLLGKYQNEATVDGCHPTDLGFMMITENLEKQIKKILKD
ncbi:MAG: SGNH/GDSL hydrolase family protein [Bacilli bacterium]|nr:SGNH/GDSL hydrolase family protein [Bacilli bacterium]